MLVLEPGALTPTLRPFRSFGDLYLSASLLEIATVICGAAPASTNAWKFCLRDCMLIVCSYAPATTSALPPTTASSERVPPAKSLMRTFRPFVLEIAEALGDRQRQVIERRLAADGDVHVRLFDLRMGNARVRARAATNSRVLHVLLLWRKSY